MPWTGPQFASRFNHGLTPDEAAHAARIADAILKGGAAERIAIATASKLAEHYQKRAAGGGIMHRDAGGSTDPSIAGVAPSTASQNPLEQGMIQRYSSMSPEQLQQLAVQLGGSPQAAVVQKILQQKRIMSAQQPAQAQQSAVASPMPAQQQARGGMTHRDMGGGMSPSQETPWWTKAEARNSVSQPHMATPGSGFLHGATPGRADAIRTTAPAGAYVLPADVVSGLGQGNSLAGAAAVQRMIETGPGGMPLPRAGQRNTIPRGAPEYRGNAMGGVPNPLHPHYGFVPKARPWTGPKLYRGGSADGDTTPVALSDGEYVLAPHEVERLGKGDHRAGIKWLDKFVVDQRAKHIKKLKSLPGPVKTQ